MSTFLKSNADVQIDYSIYLGKLKNANLWN